MVFLIFLQGLFVAEPLGKEADKNHSLELQVMVL